LLAKLGCRKALKPNGDARHDYGIAIAHVVGAAGRGLSSRERWQ